MESIISFVIALVTAPLFPGMILKVKAFFAGKKGPPLLIKYYTLVKLLRKGSVYSTSSTFVFKLGPIVSFAASLAVLLFFPLAGTTPLLSFHGDAIVLFYILGNHLGIVFYALPDHGFSTHIKLMSLQQHRPAELARPCLQHGVLAAFLDQK